MKLTRRQKEIIIQLVTLRLKERRLALGTRKRRRTQKEFAERLGVTQSYISKLEAGKINLDIFNITAIRKLYKFERYEDFIPFSEMRAFLEENLRQ